LLRNYGCGSEVSTFYKKINAARTAIATSFTTATDTSIKHTAALAALFISDRNTSKSEKE